MEMKEHILNTLKTSESKDKDGWMSSYIIAKDAHISRNTVMLQCSELAMEGKLERKKETVKNVMRISWRIKQ